MKKIGYIFIAIGIILLSYVGISQYMVYQEQNALMATVNQIGSDYDSSGNSSSSSNSTSSQANSTSSTSKTAMGILQIPSIGLKVAIVEGDSLSQLNYAVGHIPETGQLGQPNSNFAIAGHRSHISGRFFNKLGEVETNDLLYIQTKDTKYVYKVYQKLIVKPEQVEVLKPQQGKSIVTLVTCDPVFHPVNRLIIYAEKVSEQKITQN